MSFSSLGIGVSALTAAQRAVETAAHNVANAGTDGYTRQRVAIQTAMPTPGTAGLRGDGMRGTGVTVMSIERLRDRLADVAFRSETGVEAAAAARAEGLSRTESTLGPYGGGAPESLSRFLAAWDGLSLNPSDGAARATVLSTGAGLADTIRATAVGLDAVSTELTARVDDHLEEVNGLLTHVAGLNLAITRAEIGGSQPNDLYDQRDNALDRVISLTGATTSLDAEGVPQISLGGVSLVADGVATRFLRSGEGSTLALETSEGTALTAGGTMGGYLSVIKSDIPAHSAQLDVLAGALRDRVNALHADSTDSTGTSGKEFFVGAGARQLHLAELTEADVAVSRSGSTHDGEGALAMSALRTEALVGNQPIGAALRAFAAKVGQSVTDATRSATTAKAGLQAAALTRASSNGVNIDEEMVDLVKYQHAYSAASRVITIVDEMLDKIINGMGR